MQTVFCIYRLAVLKYFNEICEAFPQKQHTKVYIQFQSPSMDRSKWKPKTASVVGMDGSPEKAPSSHFWGLPWEQTQRQEHVESVTPQARVRMTGVWGKKAFKLSL